MSHVSPGGFATPNSRSTCRICSATPAHRADCIKTACAAIQICVSREFHLFNSYSSGPIADWLRGLAALAHLESGGEGVGAVGMCVTGNFALSMMLEPAMLAPVLSQPSLPFGNHAGMHIGHDELRAVRERLDRDDLTVRAYRFRGDCD